MTIVVYNYNRYRDGLLMDFSQELEIPDYRRVARWTLEGINILLATDGKTNFAYVDISFPELMREENIIFSNGGDAPEKNAKAFRFYKDHHQISSARIDSGNLWNENSVFEVISQYPKWDLGEHTLERNVVTCLVKAYDHHHVEMSVKNYSIILSCE